MIGQALHRPFWKLALASLAVLLVSGCGGSDGTAEEPVIASFKEKKLTASLLQHYIPEGVSAKDSARYADQFIKQWLKEQAVMDKALSADPDLSEKVEFKVQDYRAKLIMNTYETQLVEREMDKEVPMSEVVTYYEAHKDNFRSKEALYNYFYLVSTSNSLNEVSSWMRSNSVEDKAQLKQWADTNALEAKLDSTYVGATRISEVSKGYYGNLQKAEIGKLIRWNGVIQGERRRYLFKMLDMVEQGELLPVRLCADKIRNLILNERKIKLIESTEEKILKNARASNYIREY